MANLNAILGGVAAAAPGVAQGVQNYQAGQAQQQAAIGSNAQAMGNQATSDILANTSVNAMDPSALDAGITGTTPGGMSAAQSSGSNPMSDASHPFWNVMQSVAGAIPSASSGGAQGLQNGGVVKANYGRPTIQPEFTKGPAVPTGPNATAIPSFAQAPQAAAVARTGYEAGGVVNSARQQAIQVGVGRDQTGVGQSVTPPSTEGQMLTMAGGGVVPEGYDNGGAVGSAGIPMQVQQAGPGVSVPMTGPQAGFVQGFAEGQTIGNNLYNAFHRNKAVAAEQSYAESALAPDANNPNAADAVSQQPPSMVDKARDAVEGFFHHLHEGTLNDQHVPNGPAPGAVPAGGQPAGAAPAGASPQAIPAGGQGAPAQAASPVPAGGSPQQPPGAMGGQSPPAQPAPAQNGGGQSPGGVGGPGVPPAPPAQPAAQPSPQQAQQAQSAGTQQAIAKNAISEAQSDPAAKQGVPQQSAADSGKPHSLTPAYWAEMQRRKIEAVKAMIATGMDANTAYNSLSALQTSHFQGQILKQMSAADVAYRRGDMDAVKQALSNVNYYLPNGQGSDFHHVTADEAAADKTGQLKTGQLTVSNPFAGLYGHENDPKWMPVNEQTIQQWGAAALDPRTITDSQMKLYSAQMQAQSKAIQAQGDFLTGQGRAAWGQAALTKAQVDQQMVPVNMFLKKMYGVEAASKAGFYDNKAAANPGQPKVSMASINSAQKAAMAAVDNNAQGYSSTIPLTDQHGIANPAGGRVYPDPTKIPTLYKGMSPDQHAATRGLAGTFAAANPGLSPQEAADLAARVVRAGNAKSPQVHINPETHKPEKDIAPDPANNSIHIWVGNGYKTIWVQPSVLSPGNQGIPSEGGSDSGSDESADDTAPAIEPSDSNQMG